MEEEEEEGGGRREGRWEGVGSRGVGERAKRGRIENQNRIRCVGLGPTPQSHLCPAATAPAAQSPPDSPTPRPPIAPPHPLPTPYTNRPAKSSRPHLSTAVHLVLGMWLTVVHQCLNHPQFPSHRLRFRLCDASIQPQAPSLVWPPNSPQASPPWSHFTSRFGRCTCAPLALPSHPSNYVTRIVTPPESQNLFVSPEPSNRCVRASNSCFGTRVCVCFTAGMCTCLLP